MHRERVGSIVLVDADGVATGMLTERDLLSRVLLPGVSMQQPISSVASSPVIALAESESLSMAALSMVEHDVRHVVVTRNGDVCGVVSERNLFALQRLSLAAVGDSIAYAGSLDTLAFAANDIRALSRSLVGNGVAARVLTELISRLNDQLTQRLIVLLAQEHRLSDHSTLRWCWLAFGSEGRQEQTISTDQDNGIIFAVNADQQGTAHNALLLFARAVNRRLAGGGRYKRTPAPASAVPAS